MAPPDAPLRVVLGGVALTAPLTGIGQYVYQLAQGLQRRVDLELFYGSLGFSREVRNGGRPAVGRVRAAGRRLPKAYDIAWALRQWSFTRGVRKLRREIYHEPNYLPYAFDGPTVVTVHDLSWIRYPQTHPPERVRTMERRFEPGLRRADYVLTDAESVRQEVIATFGIAPARVRAVPLGVDAAFRPRSAQEARAVLEPLALAHGRFFLCVGTLEPRKNLRSAVAAYQGLPEAVQERHPLVLAGMKGWESPDFEALLRPLERSGRLRRLGYLDREALATVTASARALVYPSLYEGFGLPPLEAMACGVPVVTSNLSSLPEVVGDAGLLVEPLDVDAIRAAMLRLAEDDALWAQLSARSRERAAGFTWDACVDSTVACYRHVLGR